MMDNTKKIILCIGHESDPHVEGVRKKVVDLTCGEIDLVVFEPLNGKLDSFINFVFQPYKNGDDILPDGVCGKPGKNITGYIQVGDKQFPFSAIQAVWYRWKPMPPTDGPSTITQVERARQDFVKEEWREVIRSLPHFLPNARWLNPLENHRRSSLKPIQLAIANSVGLHIPSSRVTNDVNSALCLYNQAEEKSNVIYKTLSPLFVPPDKLVFTTQIPMEKLQGKSAADSVAQCPGIYQERIYRKSDTRVVIVGKQVFPVKIDSQSLPSDHQRLDWRRDQHIDQMYSVTKLPAKTHESLLEFHEKCGLVIGAYDLLQVDDEDYVFLECNPGGAWLWLEEALGEEQLPICKTVAKYLCGIEN